MSVSPEESPLAPEDLRRHVASAWDSVTQMRAALERLEHELHFFYTLRLLGDPEISGRIAVAVEQAQSDEGFPDAVDRSALETRARELRER